MSLLFRFTSLLWALLLVALGSATLQSCGSDKGQSADGSAGESAASVAAGPQPLVDSTYVINTIRSEPAFKAQLLAARRFYRERKFKLGWFKDHQLVPQAQTLQNIIAKAKEEGLDPKDYQVKDFKKLFAELEQVRADSARRNALERKIDVALTGTYLKWASDYYRGAANPRDSKNTAWQVKPNKIKLHKALLTFLGERKSRYNYYEFAPLHPEYDQLRKALAAYRAQERAGGWPVLPATLKLKPGQSSPAVPALRQRLLGGAGSPGGTQPATTPAAMPVSLRDSAKTGKAAVAPVEQVYGPDLVSAVKTFQEDAGLRPDGIVSGETLRQLNVPIGSRIDQIILNMERWRWLPKRFEPSYLLVNIPEYTLHVIENGKEAFNMRVIVGKSLHETPIFSDKMEYVVLAPYWNVPFSIIENELKDKLIADPHYIDHLDMEVVKGYGKKAVAVDPSSIDWAGVTEENFKYTLRRRPGPENDLGNMKFIFPNSNDVYLHDTPHRELFSQSLRSFSHGCVRVQDPLRLATYLLRDKPGWDQQTILDTVARRREKYVPLKTKLPVYLVYFTAWADADGHPHFRDDIYGHDKALAREYFD
ncbi:L,D-transpeptidase family protein [Hymenobacter sp. BT770]|uniref:L,D-transpeptidase family protein n=1 Tax=Hymenobacter sp. BT770 TaxID=2886942 RepID=UPI001D12290B|nr:L,D-transpeptidase family protein [Hymenobacter sp. BT770]MCC3153538.1 L,D-transpeptidase family protein [Hymenobacter sp. BT770]MDO3415775.1 L,D-transpeptidase family protein [Hymenobacter sp. BT770]